MYFGERILQKFYTERLFPLMKRLDEIEVELTAILNNKLSPSAPNTLSAAGDGLSVPDASSVAASASLYPSATAVTLPKSPRVRASLKAPPIAIAKASSIAAFWAQRGLKPDDWRQLSLKTLEQIFGAGFLQPLEQTDQTFSLEFSELDATFYRRLLTTEAAIENDLSLVESVHYTPPETIRIPLPELPQQLFSARQITIEPTSFDCFHSQLYNASTPSHAHSHGHSDRQQASSSTLAIAALMPGAFVDGAAHSRGLRPRFRLTGTLKRLMLSGRSKAIDCILGEGLKIDKHMYMNRVFNIPLRFPHPALIALLLYSRYSLQTFHLTH